MPQRVAVIAVLLAGVVGILAEGVAASAAVTATADADTIYFQIAKPSELDAQLAPESSCQPRWVIRITDESNGRTKHMNFLAYNSDGSLNELVFQVSHRKGNVAPSTTYTVQVSYTNPECQTINHGSTSVTTAAGPTSSTRPSTPETAGATPPRSTPEHPATTTPNSTPETPIGSLGLTLTVPDKPIQVGQLLSYTVTLHNTGTQPLTGVTFRDTTADPNPAWQSLGNLATGTSTTASGSFGPFQDDHIPHIILTVRVDSDQTEEQVVSQQVKVVAASTESTTPQQQPTVDLSEQQPALTPILPRIPSTLVLRVVRVRYEVPDVHLAHNIPDLLLTLADGSETTCDFLTHYESTGGLTRWGHTISEVLVEHPNTLTQYYQRGVVDCHVRDGVWLMERRLAWDYIGGGAGGAPDLGVEPHLVSHQPGEQLGPWGHVVSNFAVDGTYIGFLDFFTAVGGVESFGYPKTDARYDDDPRAVLRVPDGDPGVIRQYFQAAVLEHHPSDPRPVKLYLIGDALRNWRYPTYDGFASFGPYGPLSEGQSYYPPAMSNILQPAG